MVAAVNPVWLRISTTSRCKKASLPSEDRGSHLKECAQLEALKQPCHGVLPESPEDGAGRSPQPKTIHSDKYFRFTSSAFESKAAG
jgi:hypothetical protein